MKEYKRETDPYKDIIDLPRHVSTTRKKMSLRDRSAQFSPFAAVVGHESAIRETSRITEQKMILDENAKNILDEKLQIIQENLGRQETIDITYFEPDENKSGGSYVDVSSQVKKIDTYNNTLVLGNNLSIDIEDIIDLNGHIFNLFDTF